MEAEVKRGRGRPKAQVPVLDPVSDAAQEILEALTPKIQEAPLSTDVNDPNDPIMILSPIKVDKFNTINRKIELTPAVCPKCGLDVCYEYKLPPWEKLDPIAQAKIITAIGKHKEGCGKSNPQIMRKSEMQQSWLTASQKGKAV